MGHYVIDPWVMKLDRALKELQRIQDYNSDILVLFLESFKIIVKINTVEQICE